MAIKEKDMIMILPGISGMRKAQKGIKSALKKVDELRSLLDMSVYNMAIQVGDDENLKLIVMRRLYWRELDIKPSVIADAFGFGAKTRKMVQFIGSEYQVGCDKCGSPIYIKSRSELIEARKRKILALCSTCKKSVDAEQNKRWAESKARRVERLKYLKTMPYSEYLKTPEWQETRKNYLSSVGYHCQVCNASEVKIEVHHRTYERRGQESFKDLIALCWECHDIFHKNGKLVTG